MNARETRLVDLFDGVANALPDVGVTDLTTHSGSVAAGGLFLACQGIDHHGLDFLADALAKRPAVVAWEPGDGIGEPALPQGVIGLRVAGLGAHVGTIADRFFGAPSQQIRVAGVTGTNGKTTTAWLARSALHALGSTAGYMGTLGYGIGEQLTPSALTTPGCISVHRRLRELADAGADVVVMEVSSHGLDQGRIDGLRLRTAAFTNLSRDHLDYHGTIENYRATKARLFDIAPLECAVINVGDAFGAKLAVRLQGKLDLLTVALLDSQTGAMREGVHPRLTGTLQQISEQGLRLRLEGDFGTAELNSPLWGSFNAENLLVAAGILLSLGVDLSDAARALSQSAAPAGRMQVLRGDTEHPLVVVDFAHTPDALSKVLITLREHCQGEVSVVFGCGGDRDQGKRGEMGAIASQQADRIVLTSDNPRSENPEQIIHDILAGVANPDAVEVLPDRAQAIRRAIATAKRTDVVLVAGKGSETYQLIGERAVPFSDIDVVSHELGRVA